MNHKEEQSNEIEALEAIFPSEFKRSSAAASSCVEVVNREAGELEIALVPIPEADDTQNHVGATLYVKYTAKYPEQMPVIDIRNTKGLLSKQVAKLRALAVAKANESLGTVSLYQVAEAVKEWLVGHNVRELGLHEQALQRHQAVLDEEDAEEAARQEEERKKEELVKMKDVYVSPIKPGTIVTMESFANWKVTFDAEVKAAREKKELADKVARGKAEQKLTGRELFQRNLVKDVEEGEGGAAAAEGKDVFWYNEDMYKEELDLPEDEGEEDEEVERPKLSEADLDKPLAEAAAAGEGEEEGDEKGEEEDRGEDEDAAEAAAQAAVVAAAQKEVAAAAAQAAQAAAQAQAAAAAAAQVARAPAASKPVDNNAKGKPAPAPAAAAQQQPQLQQQAPKGGANAKGGAAAAAAPAAAAAANKPHQPQQQQQQKGNGGGRR